MTGRRRYRCISRPGRTAVRLLAAALIGALTAGAAQAQFLPPGFFATLPEPGAPAQVEANTLGYNADTDVISAEGRVVMRYSGYTISCDTLRYDQGGAALECIGNVVIEDPQGSVYRAERIAVTDGMKEAVLQSLTLTTSDGAQITAGDARFSRELKTQLLDASYAPCGTCVDAKGNQIGWRVKAAKLVQDDESKVVYFEQPSLEVLGVPVAWLPWLYLPDPSSGRTSGFQLPSVDYKAELGGRLRVPYFIAAGPDTDILLAPQLMTRQGFLMEAEWQQRFSNGALKLSASGLYQLDPDAFTGVGNREWRGAIQSSGQFRPVENWTAGWSYTAFTDAAYLPDYDFDTSSRLVNEAWATHLSDDHYADVRVQEFKLLGNVTEAEQNRQALAVPNARGTGYYDLGDYGQARLTGNLLGVMRGADATASYGGVDYVLGFEGQKVHGTGEASWQNQVIVPGGVAVTPYLGLRADITSYDDMAASLLEPGDELLLHLTPVAAVDVRLPLVATAGSSTHVVEPIGQLVWRGSDVTAPGITNDNAHSLVLDDTNIFSYDRFTGTDRQETGLRANVGVRYLASFDADAWLELVAGQSFHLAGTNSFAVGDEVNTGLGSGLEQDASYIVLGARGSPFAGLTLGSKMLLDTDEAAVARAGIGGDYQVAGYSVGGDYIYLPADAATGVIADQHEITVRAGAPLPFDYWRAAGSLSWDLATTEWLEAKGEVYYDDGYFLAGAFGTTTGPTHTNPDSIAFGVTFKLKGPGMEFGF